MQEGRFLPNRSRRPHCWPSSTWLKTDTQGCREESMGDIADTACLVPEVKAQSAIRDADNRWELSVPKAAD